MPVLDGDFEAFVMNLGKYNEGMLIGEWVKLPTTEEEMQKVFERIGIGKQDEFGQPYEEWFITDYECPIYGVQKMLGEYESLDKLNYLAALIDELSLSDQEKLVAIMEAGCDEVSDIDDLINLTFNLEFAKKRNIACVQMNFLRELRTNEFHIVADLLKYVAIVN